MVYDPEKETGKKSYTPEEISEEERRLGREYDESDSSYNEDLRGDRQRELREASQSQAAEEKEALGEALGSTYSDLKEQDDENFYKGGKKGFRARISGMSRRRKGLALAGGGGLIGIVMTLGGFFGFFNAFKLDFMLNNIDAVAFAKVNAVFDRRSDRWVRSYVQLRLREFTGDVVRNPDGSVDFRSDGVDRDRPLFDWYRTMRSNGFEERILNKNGIFFTANVDADGRVRYVKIQTPAGDKDIDVSNRNAGAHLSNIDGAVREIFEGPDADRRMRREIKRAVNDNTHYLRVLKRRQLRKDIQNKVGVREWRFFEKTRNNITEKKNEFKKKMLLKILPEDTKSGKFLICIFGLGPCPSSADPNHPDSRAGAPASGDPLEDNGDRAAYDGDTPVTDADGNTTTKSSGKASADAGGIVGEAVDEIREEVPNPVGEAGERAVGKFRATLIGKMVSKLGIALAVVDIVDTLDIFHRIHENITGNKLSAMVVNARGLQAAQAYTQYAIMRDQQKTGDLTAKELGYVMEGLSGMQNSEGYDYFFNRTSRSTVSAAADKETFCSEEYVRQPSDYYWICDDIKIGGKNGGNTIQEFYKKPAFSVIRKIMEAYDKVRSNPVTGFFADIVSSVGGFVNDIVSGVLEPVLAALGITERIDALVVWMSEKFMVALGAGPILTGDPDVDHPGLVMNMIGQGAAYLAEVTTRSAGGAADTPITRAYTEKLTSEYLAEERTNLSLYERYFALDNTQSFAANSLFSVITTSYAQSFTNLSSTILSTFGSLFASLTGRARAATYSGGAAELAGLDTYSIPPQCVENDPLTVPMIDLTNADELGFVEPNELSWQLLNDEDAFWAKIFSNNDLEDEAARVYNCATFDQRVRGGLGYTSGYTDDDGLEDGPSAGGSQSPVSGLGANGLNGYTIPCQGDPARQRTVGARDDTVDWTGIPDSGTIGNDSSGNPIKVYIREPCTGTDVKTIVIVSSIHASENYGQPISFDLLYKKDLPDNLRIIAIPELNGSRITSGVPRVNANGVNLNRNFDYRWNEMIGDTLNTGSTNYRGTHPASEPETQAVINFLQTIGSEVSLLIAYHDNLNYVGVNGDTNHNLAISYQATVNARGANLNRRTDYINQKGSLDGWFNKVMKKPSMLVEMPSYSNNAILDAHADAVINLVESGLL